MLRKIAFITLLAAALAAPVWPTESNGFGLAVLVDDSPRPEYRHRGTIYIEALRGEEYSLRVSNPTPFRVAVALSVDGLNTIDAKHTPSRNAAKWVLGPYESTVISGWQVSDLAARRFFFTGERRSYGALLGQTENLGVIEAVFYRERQPIALYQPREERNAAGASKEQAAPAPRAEASAAGKLSDDYAATGMGNRTQHEIERVSIDLEDHPAASIRLRYEFRPQLVKLGIFPSRDPLDRREHARGFGGYCPEP